MDQHQLAIQQQHIMHQLHIPVPEQNIVTVADCSLAIGQEFTDVETCRRTLKDIAIALHFDLRIVKSDRSRFIAKCSKEGCAWRVHVAKCPGVPTFSVRTLHGEHTCEGVQNSHHQQATVGWVARSVEKRVRNNPQYKPKEILQDIREQHGVAVSTGRVISLKSPRKRLSDEFSRKPKWNPRDPEQIRAAKEAVHVAASPASVVCRNEEQNKVLDFCKDCIQQEKSGSLYVCGCPGTGKTLCIDRVKQLLQVWSKEVGYQSPDMLAINCTSLTSTSEIFSKILEKINPQKRKGGSLTPLRHLQNIFSQKSGSASNKMMLLIVDEMDYLITRNHAVLHDLFMLTTYPFSRCILIGIANAIDLADRFLPKLESLNCKPAVITFRAYSKDQILKILQQRIMVLGYDIFQTSALEFCARKVAAASGDMRRALGVCRTAIEVLEAELGDATQKQEIDIVRFDHMDIALSKAFNSAVLDTLQSLPQHQQILLCSIVKLFRLSRKNATTIGELNKAYVDICKSTQVPALGMLEFTSMCGVLSDQGLLKIGQSREVRLRRITLQINSAEVTFAFKGNRFFQSCLEQ